MEVRFNVDGVDHRAQAQLMKGILWVHCNGRTFTLETGRGQRSRGRAGQSTSSDQVIAPMPGKVTKIMAQQGSAVQVGQALLVMEAMKMEYTLKAEMAGEVSLVSCAVGDQVELGKSLVKIKPVS